MTTPPSYIVIGAAERHGIDPVDTLHALRHPVGSAFVEAEPPDRPDSRVLVVGPARDGQLLEILYVPTDTAYRVIHSMRLRPSTRANFL